MVAPKVTFAESTKNTWPMAESDTPPPILTSAAPVTNMSMLAPVTNPLTTTTVAHSKMGSSMLGGERESGTHGSSLSLDI